MRQIKTFKFSGKAFVLIEILTVIAILAVLAGLAIPIFRLFEKESDLKGSAEKIVNILRLAQNKTLSSEGAGKWGVFFSTSTLPHQYILFQGSDYSSRNPVLDQTYDLPKNIEIYEINLVGGSTEVTFDRITGVVSQYGNLVLRLKTNPAKTKSIFIENSGISGLFISASPSDENRIKDSRRVCFDYGRVISIATEKLVLTLNGSAAEEILIADNLTGGQIDFEKEINVSGSLQKLKIYTTRLNNPDARFCVRRDRRYNDKSLRVDIDDALDPDSGSLVEYSADGLSVTSTSSFVTNLKWQ